MFFVSVVVTIEHNFQWSALNTFSPISHVMFTAWFYRTQYFLALYMTYIYTYISHYRMTAPYHNQNRHTHKKLTSNSTHSDMDVGGKNRDTHKNLCTTVLVKDLFIKVKHWKKLSKCIIIDRMPEIASIRWNVWAIRHNLCKEHSEQWQFFIIVH